jgi:hypothetical protein
MLRHGADLYGRENAPHRNKAPTVCQRQIRGKPLTNALGRRNELIQLMAFEEWGFGILKSFHLQHWLVGVSWIREQTLLTAIYMEVRFFEDGLSDNHFVA